MIIFISCTLCTFVIQYSRAALHDATRPRACMAGAYVIIINCAGKLSSDPNRNTILTSGFWIMFQLANSIPCPIRSRDIWCNKQLQCNLIAGARRRSTHHGRTEHSDEFYKYCEYDTNYILLDFANPKAPLFGLDFANPKAPLFGLDNYHLTSRAPV